MHRCLGPHFSVETPPSYLTRAHTDGFLDAPAHLFPPVLGRDARLRLCSRAGMGLKIQEDTTHGVEHHGGQVHVYATSDAQHIGRRFGTCIMPKKGSTTELSGIVRATPRDVP